MSEFDRPDVVSMLQRADVLEACRDGPVGRPEIAERAGCSRSTAYRATGTLSERGLIDRANGGYRLTGAGRATLDHLRRFLGQLDGTDQIRPLYDYVEDPAFVRRAHLFADAELVTQEAERPYHIENRVKAVIEGTQDRMIGMTAGLGSPALADAMFERIGDGVEVDWILPADVYGQFNDAYGDLSAASVEGGQTAVHVNDDVPVDLAVYDETLVVIGFDRERGVLGVVAIAEEPAAVAWAREAFEACREAAERVE